MEDGRHMSTENEKAVVQINSGVFWRLIVPLFAASVLGFAGWLTSMHSRVSAHSERILVLESQVHEAQRNIERRLDRIETALDKLVDQRKHSP